MTAPRHLDHSRIGALAASANMACLIHDAGNAAGQGGLGAVWGSKRLKAISIIGTNAIEIHDPKALLRARLWYLTNKRGHRPYVNTVYAKGKSRKRHRPQACVGCHGGCRGRYEDGIGNEVICAGSHFYKDANTLDIQRAAWTLRCNIREVRHCRWADRSVPFIYQGTGNDRLPPILPDRPT